MSTVFSDLNSQEVETEQKNGLSYQPWAKAWAKIKEYDPEASYCAHRNSEGGFLFPAPKGYFVEVSTHVKGQSETMMLPVMNYKNDAVANPDATEVNKAIMRCLVKSLALHGLGLYLYEGEDIPASVKEKREVEAKAAKSALSLEQMKEFRKAAQGRSSSDVSGLYKAWGLTDSSTSLDDDQFSDLLEELRDL